MRLIRMGASPIAPVYSVLMRLPHWFIDGAAARRSSEELLSPLCFIAAAAADTACRLPRFDWVLLESGACSLPSDAHIPAAIEAATCRSDPCRPPAPCEATPSRSSSAARPARST